MINVTFYIKNDSWCPFFSNLFNDSWNEFLLNIWDTYKTNQRLNQLWEPIVYCLFRWTWQFCFYSPLIKLPISHAGSWFRKTHVDPEWSLTSSNSPSSIPSSREKTEEDRDEGTVRTRKKDTPDWKAQESKVSLRVQMYEVQCQKSWVFQKRR